MKITMLLAILLISTASIYCQTITVSQNGNGNYKTVQEALNAVPLNNIKPIIIIIKNGNYKEKLHLDLTKDFVTIHGEDEFKTILTYDDHTGKISPTGDSINTRTSYSFLIKGNNFKADNITIQNNAGFNAGQAVAAEVDGDKSIFINCRFIGFQDILFTNNENSRQYYKDCYLEGTTDFIFGSATVWFEHCQIHSKKNSHITAASTPQNHPYGYVFNNCELTGDTSLHGVSLGRPWRPYANVIYMHCNIGPHILPEGWRNWNNTDSYKTARYSEFENIGLGADTSKRVNWSHQLTAADAKEITIKNVLNNWNPLNN